eukprot:Seg940.2 transcript_id=Seg940.2/GoldUCD/mRNA.D3Y31 product="hypothetical protein" protein_id=Seg940.2/GoldUCD/D3Y31
MSSNLEEQDCMREAEEASKFMEELDDVLYDMDLKLEQRLSPARSLESVASSSASTKDTKQVRAKLPKLELQKFDGKPQNWFEFWDSFCGAVDDNGELPDAMKFQYLKKSLLEPAKQVVSGFKVTGESYREAIELLKERFAKPALIRRGTYQRNGQRCWSF